ncbi:hypothetical protein PC128_g23118 [Phytophthora cactorum]|nr:hypothetical protein PC128_g23118 [Phytophthora cactorum]
MAEKQADAVGSDDVPNAVRHRGDDDSIAIASTAKPPVGDWRSDRLCKRSAASSIVLEWRFVHRAGSKLQRTS